MDKKPDYIILTRTEEKGNSRVAVNLNRIIFLQQITLLDQTEGTRIYMQGKIIDTLESMQEILNLSKSISAGLTKQY